MTTIKQLEREILRDVLNSLYHRASTTFKVLGSEEAMYALHNCSGNKLNKLLNARKKCENKALALWEATGYIEKIISKITD